MKRSSLTPRLLFAAAVAAGPALAQTRPADVRAELPEPAQRAWDAAKQLAGASDFKAALVEFQRAYTLSHNPRVLFNVGVTQKLLTHYARAVEAWELELQDGGGRLAPAEVQELKNAISIVQQFVTTIEVKANVPEATLFVDDDAVGKTPFISPVRVDVGKHTFRLSKDGFVDALEMVDIASGPRPPVSFTLEPLNKTAVVTVSVAGAPHATVFIDGRDFGPAPFRGELSADKHTIEGRAPGYSSVSQTVDVIYNQPLTLALTISAERHAGRLRVLAPEGASISVDGRTVGGDTWEGPVSSVGGHQVVVRKTGFQTYSTEISVADDQVREVTVPLNHEVSTNWVAWSVGTIAVVTGGIVAGYFVFKPSQPSPFVGDFSPGITTANHSVHF